MVFRSDKARRSSRNPAARQNDDPLTPPDDPTELLPVVKQEAPPRSRRKTKKRSPSSEAAGEPVPEPQEAPDHTERGAPSIELLNGPDDGTLLTLTTPYTIIGREPAARALSLPLSGSGNGDASGGEGGEMGQRQHVALVAIPSDPRLSRTHLLLLQQGDEWFIRDLGSSNGTFFSVTGQRISAETNHPLAPGDVVRAGDTYLRLTYAPAESHPSRANS